MKPTILKTKSFAKDAADLIIKNAVEAIATRGSFILGLCGGKTPEPVYAEIARQGQFLNWSNIFITFGDERCVGPEHIESNFRMAKESFLKNVPIPSENIFRIQGELPPNTAAMEYEKRLLELQNVHHTEMLHDLLLLGVGDDGHTASLFPGSAALTENERLVVANYVEKFDSNRITFTYKLINNSRNICFLVNDSRKDKIVSEILNGNPAYPAAGVSAKESLTWVMGT
jgi:6-phosphogluconolactonase